MGIEPVMQIQELQAHTVMMLISLHYNIWVGASVYLYSVSMHIGCAMA